jgi:uncharacterized protein
MPSPAARGDLLAAPSYAEVAVDRIAPTLRPPGRPAGFQRWRELLFLHWETPIAALRAVVPPALELDTFEGRAYVGVVAFTMRDVSPSWSPSVPGISNFHELNVRTYVHQEGRAPGVWFFSLDAAKAIAVVAARVGWHLPYHYASMDLESRDGEVHYRSERRWPGPVPARFDARYRVGAAVDGRVAAPGTFEHFLAERYLLFAASGGAIKVGQVHHAPYPLHRAEVTHVEESVVAAAGLPAPKGAPHVLYSPGVDVDVYALTPAAARG